MRQVILDTETTGLYVDQGHRIIEIGCVELVNRKLTGQVYHQYINPEREIDQGAIDIHGITNDFLQTKPLFRDIAKSFLEFVKGDELIIHNAPFDIGFINAEFQFLKSSYKPITEYCQVIDTLALARQIHVGQRNSLDALCKRYSIDNSHRDLHGALLDSHLLARVYLAMTGGQATLFGESNATEVAVKQTKTIVNKPTIQRGNLVVIEANEEELTEHEKIIQSMQKKGTCLWQ